MSIGCNKSFDNGGQDEDCLLMLKMGGEVEISETPLTKSITQDDLIFLQVYRIINEDTSCPYASGIFDNVDDLKIYLRNEGGSKYRIIVSMIKNGKSILKQKDRYSDVNNSVHVYKIIRIDNDNKEVIKNYKDQSLFDTSYPYIYSILAWNQAYDNDFWLAVNEIVYNDYDSNNKSMKGIRFYTGANSTELKQTDFERSFKAGNVKYTNNIGPEFVNIGLTNPDNYVYKNQASAPYYKCDDWLYGEVLVVPNGTMVNKTIELKRVGFKIQLDPVMGITDGSVSVTIQPPSGYSSQTILSGSYSYEDETPESIGPMFFTFPDASQVWSDAENYEENFRVSVSWMRGIGVSQSFGTIPIKIKRNVLNRVKITVGTDDGDAGMNLAVEPENSDGDNINASL